MPISDKLRLLREHKGLSQEAAARGIGVPMRSYCRWEQRQGDPDVRNLRKVASFYGVSMDWLSDDLSRPS
jgi:transcriptional regulator with XRE-family HTH domain